MNQKTFKSGLCSMDRELSPWTMSPMGSDWGENSVITAAHSLSQSNDCSQMLYQFFIQSEFGKGRLERKWTFIRLGGLDLAHTITEPLSSSIFEDIFLSFRRSCQQYYKLFGLSWLNFWSPFSIAGCYYCFHGIFFL